MSITISLPVGQRRLKGALWLASVEPRLPRVHADEVVPLDASPRVLEPRSVAGNVAFYELYVLNCTVRARRPRRIFEFGTFDGRTLLNMVANSPDLERAYSLDLPRESMDATALPIHRHDRSYIDKARSGERVFRPEHAALRERIELLSGDSATFDYAPYVGRMDFVFVDASHEYEYVLNDSRHALSLLGPAGGTVFWHDYAQWHGVTRALDELRASDPRFAGLRHIEDTTLVVLEVGPSR